MNQKTTAMIELPKYKCHKEVHALRISAFKGPPATSVDRGVLTFENWRFTQIIVDADWMARFKGDASDLGYYVVYADGFKSWSPTKVFEDGYDKI